MVKTIGVKTMNVEQLSCLEEELDKKLGVDPQPDTFVKDSHKMRILPDNCYEEYLAVVLAAIAFVEATDTNVSHSAEVYKAEMVLRNALEAAGYEL